MWDKLKVVDSLQFKIYVCNKMADDFIDREELINQLLDTVKQTKQDLKMSRWIHMPKTSNEYQYYKLLCDFEAYAYEKLGEMFLFDNSNEGLKFMMQHIKKARAIYNLVDMKDDVSRMDTLISFVTAKKQAANDGEALSSTETNSFLQKTRNMYESNIHTKGMDSVSTIQAGLAYAKLLRGANLCIEAERLATKLSTISRRVHGPDHKVTINATELLKQCKKRYVIVLFDDKVFEALRYKNDGEICVVTGPITDPRVIEDERIHHIENNLLIPNLGCPVICHGLVSSSHLNGELGEVRNVKRDVTGIRLAVHFEKKGVKSALVKPANLRIAFELPSK
jgi:hypothetical protein